MLDHLDDIESDLSVFHRVDDWRQLDPPRFFRLAERLPAYQGAVRAALAAVAVEPQGPADLDARSLASMTDGPGQFPGIEYAG